MHGNETDEDDHLEFYIRRAPAGDLLLRFETSRSSLKSPMLDLLSQVFKSDALVNSLLHRVSNPKS